MESYDRVAKVVEPKRQKLASSEAELKETMATLGAKQSELKTVQDELSTLNTNLTNAKEKKKKLEKDVDLCEKKLKRAKQLIDGLGGEQERWNDNVSNLKNQVINATGDVLVSSGLIAYLGAFTTKFRNKAIMNWVHLMQKRQVRKTKARFQNYYSFKNTFFFKSNTFPFFYCSFLQSNTSFKLTQTRYNTNHSKLSSH